MVPLPFVDLEPPVLTVYYKKKLKEISILEVSPEGVVELNEVSLIRIWYMLTGIELTEKEAAICRLILEETGECVDTGMRGLLCDRSGMSPYNLGNVLRRLRIKKFITESNCIHPVMSMLKNKSISTIIINV